MPILRQHHVAEAAGEPIDGRHDFIATRNGKVAVGTEIVLDVDNQQDVAFSDCSRHGRAPGGTPRARCMRASAPASFNIVCCWSVHKGASRLVCTPCRDRQLGREGKTLISKDQFLPFAGTATMAARVGP
jgi:hypothetical protein